MADIRIMEKLKKFDEITKQDERFKAFLIIDQDSGKYKPITLEHIYNSVYSRIKLDDHVPEEIQNYFARVQNLILYSWFFYPFLTVAQQLVYPSLELALKIALKKEKEKKDGLKKLIKEALEKKLINPKYEKSVKWLPFFRNQFAHGSSSLDSNISDVIRCTEIINQLFSVKIFE